MESDKTKPCSVSCSSSRCEWIDIARLIAIILVMQSHSILYCRGNGTMQSSAVALFFLLAGYFDTKHDFVRRLKRIGAFVMVCVFWHAVACLPIFGMPLPPLSEMLTFAFVFKIGHLWFLEFLIISLSLNYIFLHLPGILRMAVLLLLLSSATYIREQFYIDYDAAYIPLLYSLFMYFAGTELSFHSGIQKMPSYLFGSDTRNSQLVSLFAIVLFSLYVVLANLHISIPFNPLYYLGLCWAILMLSYSLYQRNPRMATVLAKFGPATFLMYVVHPFIQPQLGKLFRSLASEIPFLYEHQFRLKMYNMATSCVSIVLIIIFCYWVHCRLYKRYRITDIVIFGKW